MWKWSWRWRWWWKLVIMWVIMSLKWFLWIYVSLKLFCEIGTGWFFAKKIYIGASLYVEIKINWFEHFQEDVKFWIFWADIWGKQKGTPGWRLEKMCSFMAFWHWGNWCTNWWKIITSLKLQFNKHDPENIQLCPGKTRGRRFGRHGGWHITRLLTKFMLAKHQKFLSKPKIKIFVKLARLKHLLNFASLLKQRWGDQICHNYIDFDIDLSQLYWFWYLYLYWYWCRYQYWYC